jgi:hypothetical protein
MDFADCPPDFENESNRKIRIHTPIFRSNKGNASLKGLLLPDGSNCPVCLGLSRANNSQKGSRAAVFAPDSSMPLRRMSILVLGIELKMKRSKNERKIAVVYAVTRMRRPKVAGY